MEVLEKGNKFDSELLHSQNKEGSRLVTVLQKKNKTNHLLRSSTVLSKTDFQGISPLNAETAV